MTSHTDDPSLLDRLRVGPSSRELDAEIARALGMTTDREGGFRVCVDDPEKMPSLLPHYTTDINAALSMPPDHVRFFTVGFLEASEMRGHKLPDRWASMQGAHTACVDGGYADVTAAARSICIVKLKALGVG